MTDVDLDGLDLASGMVLGNVPESEVRVWNCSAESPLAAVEAEILKGLLKPPCLVSFSGGRDSSAILAVATDVARREGLALPIPISARFAAAETDESAWQELVVSHLKICDWERVYIDDELDLLGSAGSDYLARHGLRYPPNTHFQDPLLRRAVGGSLLSGAGGDELFEPHRWGRAAMVLAGKVPVKRSDLLVVGAALAPRPVRSRVYHRGEDIAPPWLLAPGRRALLRRFHKWYGADSIRYERHMDWWRRSRYINHGQHSLELIATDHNVQFVAPFSSGRVMHALADDIGRVGFANRSAAVKHLFGHLVPKATIERRTKASFSGPLVGASTRAFAAVADPTGLVSEQWVNFGELRRAWHQDQVDIRSLPVLQICWLDSHRRGSTPIQSTGPTSR